MRLNVFLLASMVLLASADCTSATTKPTTVSRSIPVAFAGNQNDSFPKRMLRTYERMDEGGNEERVVTGFGTLAGAVKASTSKLFDTVKYQGWLREQMPMVQVLKKLNLGDDIYAALTNPNIEGLQKYIGMFNAKNPNDKISLIGTLTTHYGDDAVAKALVSAQSHKKTEQFAKELRTDQLAAWMNNKKSTENVFALLKLEDDGYKALHSNNFKVLQDYIKLVNTKTPGETSVLKTLTAGFGGENKLASIIVKAQADPLTVGTAIQLEKALFTQWLREKLPPKSAMKLLKLDDHVGNALGSLNLDILTKYISVFNQMNPRSEVSLLGTLTAHFGEDIVAKALVSAMKAPNTKIIATKLQSQQLEGWLKSEKSVDEVFTLLKLKQNSFLAFGSRKLETLEAYIKLFNSQKSADESLLGTLTTRFGGEGKLVQNLVRAEGYPSMTEKATELKTALFQKWLSEDLDSPSVFIHIFKLSETKVVAASPLQKRVVEEYKAFTVNEGVINGLNEVHPRRS